VDEIGNILGHLRQATEEIRDAANDEHALADIEKNVEVEAAVEGLRNPLHGVRTNGWHAPSKRPTIDSTD